MNAEIVFSILSLVPDRVERAHRGVRFAPEGAACRYPERVAHLVQFLHWLTPLHELGKDDQRVLGLLNAAGRPVHAADEDDGDFAEGQEEPLEERREEQPQALTA